MATTEENSPIPCISGGILMPSQQNRWRLVITDSVPLIEEIKNLLRSQIVSLKFNYHLQLLEMVVEQNAMNTHLHTLVKQLSKLSKINDYDKIAFVVEQLDGNDFVLARFMFAGCKLLDHSYALDYASGDACRHELKFSFKETKDLT